MSEKIKQLAKSGAFFSSNAPFIEDLYDSWVNDPLSVSKKWSQQFEKLTTSSDSLSLQTKKEHRKIQKNLINNAKKSSVTSNIADRYTIEVAEQQVKVLRLINAYRVRGHQAADLDPLSLNNPFNLPELDPLDYGLNEKSMTQLFNTGSLFAPNKLPLSEIFEAP